MPIPAVAALAPVVVETAHKVMDFPVIGVKRTVVRRTKKRTITTDYSLQVRGWEAALLAGLTLVVVSGMGFGDFFDKMKSWADKVSKPGKNASPEDWNKYYLKRIKQGFGLGFIP